MNMMVEVKIALFDYTDFEFVTRKLIVCVWCDGSLKANYTMSRNMFL